MKDLKYYLGLPYTAILRPDEEGDCIARIDELPGCVMHGKTPAEALKALQEVKELWITDCLENGDPVPEPVAEDSLPSGKWVQRIPRSLHKKLISLAKRENVSLNQLVTSFLAEAVGTRQVEDTQQTSERSTLEYSTLWTKMSERTKLPSTLPSTWRTDTTLEWRKLLETTVRSTSFRDTFFMNRKRVQSIPRMEIEVVENAKKETQKHRL